MPIARVNTMYLCEVCLTEYPDVVDAQKCEGRGKPKLEFGKKAKWTFRRPDGRSGSLFIDLPHYRLESDGWGNEIHVLRYWRYTDQSDLGLVQTPEEIEVWLQGMNEVTKTL